jgi:16S rRNA (guanine1207-N2)-methyltransferase
VDDHYFSPSPATASRPQTVSLTLPDLTVGLTTDAGVFSGDAVDPGTRLLLLEGAMPPAYGDLLDLGCGYGPIAVALARRSPAARIWAVDVNERAVDLCARNAEAAGCTNVRALQVSADDVLAGIPDDVRFAGIWSNPPIRAGKDVLHRLLVSSLARLAPGATAHLVVHRHLGADSLASWLEGQGFATKRRASRRGYRLLDVARRASEEPT